MAKYSRRCAVFVGNGCLLNLSSDETIVDRYSLSEPHITSKRYFKSEIIQNSAERDFISILSYYTALIIYNLVTSISPRDDQRTTYSKQVKRKKVLTDSLITWGIKTTE